MSEGHILLVDDEPEVRRLTARALRTVGLSCDLASDGEEAFDLISTQSYNGVLTDLKMPRRHGYDLCTDIMKLPTPPSVMVMTGLTDARLVRELMTMGVYDVAQKPINYDVLAMKVRSMVEFNRCLHQRAVETKPRSSPVEKVNLLHRIESTLVDLTEQLGEQLDGVFESPDGMAEPPKSIREFIRRLAEAEMTPEGKPPAVVIHGTEARTAERATCYTITTAAPVDRDWKRTGEPFKLALRDLSEGGARLLNTRAVSSEYLALKWDATQLVAKQIRVVCRVRRCKPCGPFYDIGGQFVAAD